MTKEQEQAIRDVIEEIRYHPKRNESDFNRIINWIIAAIKAYDEQVNGAAKAKSDSVVVFRRCGSNELLVFDSKESMLEKLEGETRPKLEISNIINTTPDKILPRPRDVYFETAFGFHVIGYCDCETFKRG